MTGPMQGAVSADGRSVWDADHWQPLRLTADAVAVAVRAGWGVEAAGTPRYLAEGLMNDSWWLASAAGEFVIRVIRPDIDAEQLRYEHRVVATLRQEVPEVVVPLPGIDGDTVQAYAGQHLVLYPYLDGQLASTRPAGSWEPQAAALLARIHRAGLDRRLGQRPGQARVDEHVSVWSSVRPIALRELDHDRIAHLVTYLDEQDDLLRRWVTELRRRDGSLQVGIVHGDFNPRNLILDGDRIIGVIDWEGCHQDLVLTEVAGALGPEWFQAYLDSAGPARPADAALFDGFARVNAMSGLYFVLDHGQHPGHVGRHAVAVIEDVSAQLRKLPAP